MKLSLLAAVFGCVLLAGCGGGSTGSESLTLVPSKFDITVDTKTGTVTGASPIQAFQDKTPVDLSEIIFTTSSTTVPAACFGVDQTGVPHCNTGCGSSFEGTIIATLSATATSTGAGTSATASITCTFQ